jgi:hypothetical protein
MAAAGPRVADRGGATIDAVLGWPVCCRVGSMNQSRREQISSRAREAIAIYDVPVD